MGALVTLVAPAIAAAPAQPPPGYSIRPYHLTDVPVLGRLYFEAYDPGIACTSLAEAVADIEAAVAGEYGELSSTLSLVAVGPADEVAAAIQVVTRAPWPEVPDCPFVIELFTGRAHRRFGLARTLLLQVMTIVAQKGEGSLALRVDKDNAAALALYAGLGFDRYLG